MIPSIEFTDNGLVVPTREAVTAGLWEIMRTAFGSDINENSVTPQGQLVTSLTAILQDRDNAFVELSNNMDPRYSFGIYQEGIGAIYFLKRKEATRSVARLDVVGVSGTEIPKGWLIVDEAGNEWETPVQYLVGDPLVEVWCVAPGPIQAAPGTIRNPKEAIDGIDRAENPAAAATGSLEESRANFEDRRYDSVAANGKNTNGAVFGAVNNLPGVIDAFVADNPTDSTIQVGVTNYPMIRNSLLVSIVGGDDQAIAGQIMIKGGTGCSFVGNTEVTWQDSESESIFPPTYEVKFLRPAHVTTFMRLTVIDLATISYASSEAAKAFIVDSFQSGENRARIGGLVVGANYLCGLNKDLIRPVKLELSTDGSSWEEYIRFGVDQFPVTSTANVTLVGI